MARKLLGLSSVSPTQHLSLHEFSAPAARVPRKSVCGTSAEEGGNASELPTVSLDDEAAADLVPLPPNLYHQNRKFSAMERPLASHRSPRGSP